MENNIDKNNQPGGLKNDLTPGRPDRNLLSKDRSEAPIDQYEATRENMASEASDENYEDEEMNDKDYFEKRAGDNVRK